MKQSRQTRVRKALVRIFLANHSPLSEVQLRSRLGRLGFRPNKTTIYRAVRDFLLAEFISEVDFGDGKKRYELKSDHHHHLVCRRCDGVQDIVVSDDLRHMEQLIEAKKKFLVVNHTLEFFGVCEVCQKC